MNESPKNLKSYSSIRIILVTKNKTFQIKLEGTLSKNQISDLETLAESFEMLEKTSGINPKVTDSRNCALTFNLKSRYIKRDFFKLIYKILSKEAKDHLRETIKSDLEQAYGFFKLALGIEKKDIRNKRKKLQSIVFSRDIQRAGGIPIRHLKQAHFS